jgi:hypothetical protein
VDRQTACPASHYGFDSPARFELFAYIVGSQRQKIGQSSIAIAPAAIEPPHVAALTPGIYNWAYFEHAFAKVATPKG